MHAFQAQPPYPQLRLRPGQQRVSALEITGYVRTSRGYQASLFDLTVTVRYAPGTLPDVLAYELHDGPHMVRTTAAFRPERQAYHLSISPLGNQSLEQLAQRLIARWNALNDRGGAFYGDPSGQVLPNPNALLADDLAAVGRPDLARRISADLRLDGFTPAKRWFAPRELSQAESNAYLADLIRVSTVRPRRRRPFSAARRSLVAQR